MVDRHPTQFTEKQKGSETEYKTKRPEETYHKDEEDFSQDVAALSTAGEVGTGIGYGQIGQWGFGGLVVDG